MAPGSTRPSTFAVPSSNTVPRRRPTGTTAGTIKQPSQPSRPPSRQNQHDISQSLAPETPTNYPKRPSSSQSNAPPSKRRQGEFEEGQSMMIDSKGTNIQVVVRCRGRSEREVKENSPVVVTATGGLRGKEVTVSNGLVPPISNKTYTFDRVFGPEADQGMIYDDVVAPFLEEVLAGYNCTIFAYGQTGTGKTYTMSGDLTEFHGTFGVDAGIIPRTLHRLFHALDSDDAEYSVKVSFIELYNEELRDLLGVEEDKKVKLFDDNAKKGGVVIQGMEETLITNAEEGIQRLRNGSLKRQVAATKCNDLSSRSHTVFTITVHLKETTDGEDMLRVGKLNLVDLAGSESIGRSGAADKRAREAGIINQSLLTLGRVINALVERSAHIPYRESKLTRLLQDSLGGRTKTCIIATVSPAKVNFDETLSTLEYANKAKSIHNKPQVNQMMTKKALIKEYVEMIERLKGDLRATRQKNGIYMSEESYQEIHAQNISRGQLIEEHERKIEAMEIQLKSSREQCESQLKTLVDNKKEMERIGKLLDDTNNRLASTEQDLKTTKQLLAQQTALRKAHQETEARLNSVCAELKTTLESTTSDLRGYQDKLARKDQIEEENKDQWRTVQKDLTTLASNLENRITTMSSFQLSKSNEMEKMIASFLEAETKHLDEVHSFIDTQLALFDRQRETFESDLTDAKSSGDVILGEIKVLREDIKRKVGEGLSGLNSAAETISQGIVDAMVGFQQQTHDSYLQIGHSLKSVFDSTQRHLSGQMAEMTQFRQEISASEKANISALGDISGALELALAQEREKAEQERNKLTNEVVSLITAMVEAQQGRWSTAVDSARQDLAASQGRVQGGFQTVSKGLDSWQEREGIFAKKLLSNKDEVKKSITADQRGAAIQDSARRVHAQTIELVDTQMKALDQKTQALDDFVVKARGHVATRYQQHEECLSEVASTFRSSVSAIQENVAQTRKSISHNTNAFASNSDVRASSVREFESHATENALTLKKKIFKHEILEDIPTSETPKKKDYHIPSAWPSTKPHEEILGQMNKMPLGNVDINLTSQTPSAIRVHNVMAENAASNNPFDKMVTPPFEKSLVLDKISSEGRENTVFKSKLAAPSRKRALGTN